MTANDPDARPPSGPLRINPYTVPDDQHGWRGLGVPGHFKRKWYTVLHNEQVLVTALLLLPGETSIRHSHESGELSIRYTGELRPIVTWNAPGLLHGPPEPPPDLSEPFAEVLAEQALRGDAAGDPQLAALARQIVQMQRQLQTLQERLLEHLRPEPVPTLIVDVLFPPFKTTIDDPRYAEKKTVVGQWFD
jgi:hypothetical protein